MRLERLWLRDFRSYEQAEVSLAPGLTAVLGDNGQGKTNLLEAVAWLASTASFRGAPNEALVRAGTPHAVVRAEGHVEQRAVLVEAQIVTAGRNRVLVNRQPLKRAKDLLGVLRVTVFSPDDLELVKGGPALRRGYLDGVLVALHPRNDALQGEVERVLRQRNALLKQAGGRATDDVVTTLEVWDAKLAQAGDELAGARREVLERLGPLVDGTYDAVAGRPGEVTATYLSAYEATGLAEALAAARGDDLRRGVSTVGPHRDEVELRIAGMPARTHASQGEQRSLSLALRLASHQLVTERTGTSPVLLLDDVFSELDPDRADALLANLPPGQALLTSAGGLPPRARPERILRVAGGTIDVASS
ncbi:MAG: DNA replication/repair protein RecF [Acidimicrobiia bacterium]